ncbi:branched-chain amino acid aminotransferase [Candidatus Magnetomorum sp. HK-1]|nr:branched-chain amino acid aminotransferase [Candidatus Magnetomorum sp. HK-1]
MEKGRVVWFNGELIPEAEASISIYDSALMFGDMVFEMTRSFNKAQFKLKEHIERLFASAKFVHIPLKDSIDDIEKFVNETVEANESLFLPDDEHRIMIDISRGLLSIYEDVVGVNKGPNVIIADFPLRWTVSGMGKLYDKGINAVIPSQRAIPGWLLEAKVKNRSRLHYLMANIEVSKYEGDNNWALLLDPDGYIAEGTGDNFFIVKNGRIITPKPHNILKGISRAYIFELAQKLGLPCEEKNIQQYDVIVADEAFITGTPFCLLPVASINSTPIGNGPMGPITQKLLNTWSDSVGLDIKEQIQNWDKQANEKKASGPSPYSFK